MEEDDYHQVSEKQKGYDQDAKKFSVRNDTPIKDGIVHERGCTDVLCLLIFFAFLGSMGYLAHVGYAHGNF